MKNVIFFQSELASQFRLVKETCIERNIWRRTLLTSPFENAILLACHAVPVALILTLH